jgi:hypothetical protein
VFSISTRFKPKLKACGLLHTTQRLEAASDLLDRRTQPLDVPDHFQVHPDIGPVRKVRRALQRLMREMVFARLTTWGDPSSPWTSTAR